MPKPALKLIAIIVLVAVLLPVAAHAQDLTQAALGAAVPGYNLLQYGAKSVFGSYVKEILAGIGVMIGRGLAYVGYFIGVIAGVVMTLGGMLLEWAIKLNGTVTSNPTAIAGFKVVLSVANLGFVFAIIIIAVATILRYESYAMKQTLWKLVAAALLVNFSLTIVGVFLDFTGSLSDYFVKKASGEGLARFSENLASAFGVQKFTKIAGVDKIPELAKDLGDFSKGLLSVIVSVLFAAFFTVLGAIAMVGTAFMILVRYLYLVFLIILMPLAWLFWIFPNLSHLTNRWWNTFLKWTFFMPGATFFLYLTVLLVRNQAAEKTSPLQTAEELANLPGAGALQNQLFIDDPFSTIAQMIVILGLLGGGLIVSMEMGITGSKAFVDAAKGSANWMRGAALRATGAPAAGRLAARGGAAALSSRYLRWIPGAKGLAGTLGAAGSRKAEVEFYKKRFDKLEGAALDQALSGPLSLNSAENTARLQRAVETKKMDVLTKGKTDKEITRLASHAKANDPKVVKEILDVRPDLAGIFKGLTGDDAEKEVEKAALGIRADKWVDVDKEALKKVAKYMNEAALSGLYRSGSAEKKAIVEEVLLTEANISESTQKSLLDVENKIADVLKEIKEARERGADKTEIRAMQTRIGGLRNIQRGLYTPADEKQKNAYAKLQSLKQRIGNPNVI